MAAATCDTRISFQEKVASYCAWVKAQEAALNSRFDYDAPGHAWLRNFPRSWTIATNAGGMMQRDVENAIINTVGAMPEGTPEPILRGTVLADMLDRMHPAVIPGFDLCGHWIVDGRFTWEPAAEASITPEERARLLSIHPKRHFGTRFDHTVPETEQFLRTGVGGVLRRIDAQLAGACTAEEQAFLAGMKISVEAFSRYIARHADEALRQGRHESARQIRHIATEAPRTFAEALQLIWFRFVVMIRETRSALAFGRLDRHLAPYYAADLAAGRITREAAQALLCETFAFVHWTNTAAITIGGTLADGTDATSDVTHIILDAARAVRIPNASIFARFHKDSPSAYLDACARLITAGGGMPAMMNDEVSMRQLSILGITGADAVNHCFTGCAHLFVEGLQVPWREGCVVLPRVLMGVLSTLRGVAEISYDMVMERFAAAIADAFRANREEYNATMTAVNSRNAPDVFYSAFTGDCIERRRDHNDGGARYLGVLGINLYGLGLATDMLAALKTLVFDERRYAFDAVMAAAEADFEGHESMRQELLRRAPKFGNDIAGVDAIAARIVELAAAECVRQTPCIEDGSVMRLIFPGTASYVAMGAETPATPDGRHAGEPLSDSGAPMNGRDMKGLTALLNSLGAVDHSHFNGMALNVRLNAKDFSGPGGGALFRSILGAMRAKGIQELQFNCVSTAELREAQRKPDAHRNLLIRVAGYSDRFTSLQSGLQEAIIARQEHA